MKVEIGTETPIFLFWEYLFRNFGILSLQCTQEPKKNFGDLTPYLTYALKPVISIKKHENWCFFFKEIRKRMEMSQKCNHYSGWNV
jgi:hypothetical protein